VEVRPQDADTACDGGRQVLVEVRACLAEHGVGGVDCQDVRLREPVGQDAGRLSSAAPDVSDDVPRRKPGGLGREFGDHRGCVVPADLGV
jgi:hypothetical protein